MNETINSNDIRINNTRKIIYALRNSDPVTKRDLADRLNLSLPTIASIAKELEEQGYLIDCGSAASSVGRKPSLVALNSKACYAVGVFIATHSLEIAIVDFAGNILARRGHGKMFSGTAEYWQGISGEMNEMIDETGIDAKLVHGVRVAVPYIIYPNYWDSSKLKSTPENMVPIDRIPEYFPYDTDCVEVAIAAGVPRYWYGKLDRDAAVIFLGRYIEGCILRKESVSGTVSAQPCLLGHMSLNQEGPECFCGKKGCFQEYCSTSRVIDQINGIDTSRDVVGSFFNADLIHWDRFMEAMDAGNEEYRALWDEYLDKLAYAIHNVRILLNSDIIICGEICEYIARYKHVLVEKLSAYNINSDDIDDYLHTSALSRYDACIGAALSRINSLVESI